LGLTPEHWKQIDRLFHLARDRESGERPAFLDQACQGDSDLRCEIERLLAEDSSSGNIVNFSARDLLPDSTVTRLATGTLLGPYRIERQLGAGGMGDVFRATDTRLGRAVAIKTCSEQFSQRFHREARAISSLNHPHICTLYDVGPDYIVMELIEGETFAARLKRGKLSIEQTIQYGSQIADALAAAHAKGLIHRDLKPGNIMLTKSGVKVLDFGLAKSQQDEDLTGSQAILGTPAYMAPEQRAAKECDARTDLYALGLVIYEMATGKRVPETGRQLLQPSQLDEVVKTCLAEDPEDRWQTAREVRIALRAIPLEPPQAPSRRKWSWLVASAAVFLAVAFAVLYLRQIRKPVPAQGTTRFFVSPPERVVLTARPLPAISPDGELLAFGGVEPDGTTRIWVRPMASLTAEPVPGTEGASSLFWSPDSRSIGFFAGGKIKTVLLHGGPPRAIFDASDALRPIGTWNRDGVILFNSSDRRGLYRVAVTGAESTPVTTLDPARHEVQHLWPQFLRDGRHFIYLAQSTRSENTAIYAASLDSKERRLILRTSSIAAYAGLDPGIGYLLYMQGATLMAQRFNDRRLELEGEAFPIADQVWLPPSPAQGFAAFSTSNNGVLVYRTLPAATTELVWFDRRGNRLGTVGAPANYSIPALSPDEKKLAITRIDPRIGTKDLYLIDLARGTPAARFTFDPAEETNPAWSPDGNKIAFTSSQKGIMDLYQKATSGAGDAEPLLESSEPKTIESWSPDGRVILFDAGDRLWALPLTGDRKPVSLFATSGETRATISPNGRRVAYQSNKSGREEVYVQNLPPSGSGWQVSTAGGEEPYWRRDGKELFYLSGRTLMAVDVNSDEPAFRFGKPTPLSEVRLEVDGRRSRYQAAGNGQRFLVNVPLESAASEPITVVTNWASGVKK